jgi:RNA polymerase sigma-70 factor (ECF subfamily)
MEASDAELVAALRRGERAAFDRLYLQHSRRIWEFLVRLARGRAEAEDLFQETWLSAAEHAARLAPESELLPWLYTIARNKHRSARRFSFFERRRKERLRAVPPPDVTPLEDRVEVRRERDALAAAFAEISDPHREVLVLFLDEGLDSRQVGRILGLREEAVRKRLSRARAELRERMEAQSPVRAKAAGRSRSGGSP